MAVAVGVLGVSTAFSDDGEPAPLPSAAAGVDVSPHSEPTASTSEVATTSTPNQQTSAVNTTTAEPSTTVSTAASGVVSPVFKRPAGKGHPNKNPTTTTTTTTPTTTTAPTSTTTPTTTAPTTTTTTSPPTVSTAGRWKPAPGTTWQWQLTGSIDTSVDVQMYDVDLFDVPTSTVTALHNQGRTVICYMSAGSFEDWRPDAGSFPDEVLGRSNGWSGERWLDIRRLDILGPIMEARLDLCAAKGFDGVEPDNIDGYANSTGFPLTGADQLAYNRFLADAAHARGLSIGLKNDVDQAGELEPWFDWALNEECFQYDECETLSVFIQNGKAVFHVEYELELAEFCPTTTALGFSSLRKNLDLDAWRASC